MVCTHPVRTAANGGWPPDLALFAEEGLDAFLSEDIAERGIGIVVGGEEIVPDRRGAMLVDDLKGPTTFGGKPDAVDRQPYARLFHGPAEWGFDQFGLRAKFHAVML
jgi:hypothetical protein